LAVVVTAVVKVDHCDDGESGWMVVVVVVVMVAAAAAAAVADVMLAWGLGKCNVK
jgi:hypothetical protein